MMLRAIEMPTEAAMPPSPPASAPDSAAIVAVMAEVEVALRLTAPALVRLLDST